MKGGSKILAVSNSDGTGVSSCQFTEVDYQDDSHACDGPTAELVKEDGRWKVFRYTEFAKEFIGGDGLP